jgi:maltooligosyltrehalose trehalohydrolase
MPFGTEPDDAGGAHFQLWAPGASRVELLEAADAPASRGNGPADVPAWSAALPMQAKPGGWFAHHAAAGAVPARYAFRIDGGLVVPDPASRYNGPDVHGPSSVTDPLAFDWPDDGWRGRPWHEAVVYELHIGCFTPEGTFRAAIGKLDALVALGITAIELMPLADCPGRRGWGYDGVLLYAPRASYGTPDELKQLVAAAHARGLMVLLDVVYNHFGPDGNYLHAYAQPFFDESLHTPWGAGINFGGAGSGPVREFFIHNALYWLEEFHIDGLRLDAVHAMQDASTPHFLDELMQRVRAGPGAQRHVHLVLENEHNEADKLERDAAGRAVRADAQWNDDVHHALHVLVTGERDGYYADYAVAPPGPIGRLGRALAEGFGFQGEPFGYLDGRARGTPSAHLPPTAFVDSMQTHDQIGNRAFGERIATLAAGAPAGGTPALCAVVACVLLAPCTPMLFMGEEWAASTPFLYFCDFSGELATAVTQGRRAEFARFPRFSDPEVRDHIPDPNAASTFVASQLDWRERSQPPHAGWLALYTDLLRGRHDHLLPWLEGARSGTWSEPAPGTLRLCWPLAGGRRWHLLARLAAHDAPVPADLPGGTLPGTLVYRSHGLNHGATDRLPPWSVQVALEGPAQP